MTTLITEFITFLLGGILILGGLLYRRVLPKNHSLQAVVSEESITKAIDWLAKNMRYILGFGLMFTFVALTFIYS